MRCLAFDIGGTKIAAALVENQGISSRCQIATPNENMAIAMKQALSALIQQYHTQFDYIAIASTGIIQNGILTALNPKNLAGLAEFPLYDTVAQFTDKPIFLLNDAQAATYAEYEKQANGEDFAFITVSTGVGGGVVLNGELQIGQNGIAGHIGHTVADPKGALCGCGRRGCVEAIASGRAIEQIAGISPKLLFEQFRQGDLVAKQIIQTSARAIANLCANLTISLDIKKIAIGGSVGLAAGYLALIQQELVKMPAVYQSQLVRAAYGADAGLIGVAAWGNKRLKKQENV